jgi:hypothetical protein
MRTKIKFLPFVLGAALVLGLPPVLLLTGGPSLEVPPSVAQPDDPLRALVAEQSTLELFYRDWQKDYLAAGGDRKVAISLGWTEGLSTEASAARGWVDLDLIDGAVRARIQGLAGRPADLWLVDNQDGPGRTVQPEPGDRMVRIGRLAGGDPARITAQLGREFFRGFELDLVVVSRAGETPAASTILLGTRPYFERLYTTTRVAAERARERAGLSRLVSPSGLLSMLSPRAAEANSTQILIAHGLVGQAVGQGADLFFRGTFGGNGRTCGTCHRVTNNQGLDLDFISTLPANDPLFIAEIPASQGGVPGLERPALMRGHALILENVDGLEDPTGKFTMRGVPHSLSLATSIRAPADGRAAVQRTGWSGDGAPDTGALRLFPVGAVRQHFTKSLNRVPGVDFVLPTDAELDRMEAFMLASGRLNELSLSSVTLTNADAQEGKVRFMNAPCNFCHANAGANLANGDNANFDTGVEQAPDPSQTTEAHPRDGGFGIAPRDCDGDGSNDCFGDGSFNTTPLIEAADTEPFFHNNSAATIEDAVTFFTTPVFGQSPGGLAVGGAAQLTATDIANIGKFLRVLNASFNTALSIQRNNAAVSLENSSNTGADPTGSGKRQTVNTLLSLANAEALDAIEVLSEKGLHSDAVTLLNSAISKNNSAIAETSSTRRKSLISAARTDLNSAKAKFGTGLTFTLGEGNLMF